MKKIGWALLGGVAVCHGALAALVSPTGAEYREIVCAPDAPRSVRLAAEELRDFAGRLCAAELAIVAAPGGTPAIYVGDSPALQASGIVLPEFADEGYWIGTKDGNLVIAGDDYSGPLMAGGVNPFRVTETYNPQLQLSLYGASGTLNGVYEFLYRVGDVRFYWPGESGIVLEPRAQLAVPELDMKKAPQVAYRYPWFSFLEEDPEGMLWAKRIGVGAKAPVMIMHNYCDFLKYKDSNPEYFALADGKRAFGFECVADGLGHLCLTNPATIRRWADDIIAYFEANPTVEVFPLVPNDGLTRICECPGCQAEVRPEMGEAGKFSYHIWNFTGKVAALVAERFPDKYIGNLAYSNFRTPPEELEYIPNTVVMFCNWRSMLANPESAARLHREMEAWSEKCDRIYMWTWYLDHWLPWRGLPVRFDATIARELEYVLANPKYSGEFIEAEPDTGDFSKLSFPGMQHWPLYLTLRLYMDSDADATALFEEYCERFYGPAAKPMREFWELAEERRNQLLATQTALVPDAVFTQELLAKLNTLLREAVDATPEESVYRSRVELIRQEFSVGSGRLIRLQSVGEQKMTVPHVSGFSDFAAMTPIRLGGRDGEQMEPPTWLFTGYDRQYLYLQFLCYEPEMGRLKTSVQTPDDQRIWEDDCLEIFLCPDEGARKEKCFQWIVNADGVLFDCRNLSLIENDVAWSSNATVEVVKEENRWMASVRIPFAALGINDPYFAGNLAGNFYRSRTLGEIPAVSAWSPLGVSTHYMPERFGVISLGEKP